MNKCGLRGSENYVGTVDVKFAGDMLELQSIRDAVKIMNKELRHFRYGGHTPTGLVRGEKKDRYADGAIHQFRVKCQGRGPRASVARAEGKDPGTYDKFLPLSKAERWDVYIYRV